MAKILITPEEIRKAAGDFKRESQTSQQMVSKLQSTMNAMDAQWEGMTSQKFYNEFRTWSTQMKSFVTMLDTIGNDLNKIATRFAEADRPQ